MFKVKFKMKVDVFLFLNIGENCIQVDLIIISEIYFGNLIFGEDE